MNVCVTLNKADVWADVQYQKIVHVFTNMAQLYLTL